jgi:acetyl esterase/lipase
VAASNVQRIAYGPDQAQYGELYRPHGTPRRGVVVVIHGGFWRSRFNAALGRPLAASLAAEGWTAWNIEYRRVGRGGGWPHTFDDVSVAIDHLSALDVDTTRVTTLGHSAGGHLATWAGGRHQAKVAVTGVVSQAGVLDLASAARTGVGGRAVPDLLGGMPEDVPQRYALADPMAQLPLDVPVICVHAPADDDVPIAQSEQYVAAATAADAKAKLVRATGDHYPVIDVTHPDWQIALDAVAELS